MVPRYGTEIRGGAETGARMLAEHLAADRGYEVEVLTTCALDAITWRDELPEGTEVDQRRHGAPHPLRGRARRELSPPVGRDAGRPGARASREDMERWVDLQGPPVAGAARRGGGERRRRRRLLPLPLLPDRPRACPWWRSRAVLHPAAHEEPALHLPIYDDLFARCRGFAFHSRSERSLVNERFGVATTPQVLVGLGVEEPARRTARTRGRCAPPTGSAEAPYLVCIGRVDDQKGTGMLWRFFRAYKQRHPGPLRLVLVGQVVDPPEPADDIVVTGMVDDGDKWALLRGAAGARGPLAARVLLAHRGRGADRRRAGAGQRALRAHPRALRAVGGGAVVRGLRGVRGRGRAPDDGRRGARDDAPQRPRLRGGELHLARRPGPLLRVPGALRRRGWCDGGRRRASRNGRGVPSPRGAGGGADPAAPGGGRAGRRRSARPRGAGRGGRRAPPRRGRAAW